MKIIGFFLLGILLTSLFFVGRMNDMETAYRIDKFVEVSQSFIDGFTLGRQYGTTLERANRI